MMSRVCPRGVGMASSQQVCSYSQSHLFPWGKCQLTNTSQRASVSPMLCWIRRVPDLGLLQSRDMDKGAIVRRFRGSPGGQGAGGPS